MAWRYLVLALSVHSVLGAIHKTAPTVAHGWTRRGRPDARQSITLQIGLKQPNLDRLEARLYEISAPDHPDYGQHLPSPDVAALAAPTEESYAAVLAWLRSEGVTRVRRQGAWVTFATSVGRANRVLRADFAHYARDGVTRLRTLRYSLPDHLAAHVDLVHPTTYFGATAAHAPRNHIWKQPEAVAAPAAANASCGELLTPPCVRDLYNVGDYMPDPQSGSRVGFGNFLNQTPSFADLAQFERQYNIPSQNLSVALINGGVNNQSAARGERVEADLDAQYVVALAHPLPVSAFITGGSPPFIPNLDEPVLDTNEPYLEYYDYLLAQPNSALPQVISNSYGDDEQTVPLDYARRVCDQIMQLTARGVSVLESSGDTGVGAACRATDGSNAPRFTPQFPAGCPFVTAVGGTQQYRPEAAWLGSGGGFSDYFARPKYQDAAVQAYLAEGISDEAKEYYKPFVNFSGRGFPDLAAHSEDPKYALLPFPLPSFPSPEATLCREPSRVPFADARPATPSSWPGSWRASPAPRRPRPWWRAWWRCSTTRACAPASPPSASSTPGCTPAGTAPSSTSRRARAWAVTGLILRRASSCSAAASSWPRRGTPRRAGTPSRGGACRILRSGGRR